MTENQSSVFPENLQSIDEIQAAYKRKPEYQLSAIRGGLANVAALLHVAYKSASFEQDDYEEEIFGKSIANGGDSALLVRILDEVEIIFESVSALQLQLTGGDE